MKYRDFKKILKDTFSGWLNDKCTKLAAALSYYTMFSLAPFLLIAIGIMSLVFKGETVRAHVASEIGSLLGPDSAQTVLSMMENNSKSGHGILETVIGLIILFFGASGVFGELQDSINYIWKVDPKKHSGWLPLVKDRFLSFSMVLGVGFLLLVSLIVSAGLTAASHFIEDSNVHLGFFWEVINFIASLATVTALFTLLFKVLPDTDVSWKDTWIGGLITAILFTIGKTLLGLYLGRTAVASSYGAAGSIAVVLLWVYYSSQILFIGVEFTHVYSLGHGTKTRKRKKTA